MKRKDLAVSAFLLLLMALAGYLWFSPGGLKTAPDIALTTLDGRELTLDSLQGRPVIVNFWATTCPGCIKEMPQLVKLYRELAPQGLEIVAIAMDYDPPSQVRRMVSEKQLPYPVALDSNGRAAQAFGGIKLTPTTILIDTRGRIVQQTLGDVDMSALHSRIVAMLQRKGA